MGNVSLTLVMLMVIMLVAVTLSITYVFGLVITMILFTLLRRMESVAKQAVQENKNSEVSGSSNSQVHAQEDEGQLAVFD